MNSTMRGMTFPAWRNDRDFVPLIELLLAVGPWTLGATSWSVSDSEFSTGRRGSAELARLARSGARLSTLELVDLASDGIQVVDGEITCFRDATNEPFLVLASIRGDSWDVYSAEPEVLGTITRCFPGSVDVPL